MRNTALKPERRLRILGTRGVPATHGGFETFAEALSCHLVARGWHVTVYCQAEGTGSVFADEWQGVERLHIPSGGNSPAATIAFDWKATCHAARRPGLCLTLGYNTAVFCGLLRMAGVPNVINMDGIEWQRAKWGPVAKLWFRANEYAGCHLANHLIADHPQIAAHLERTAAAAKISMIPYGADRLQGLDDAPVRDLGLIPGRYWTLVARPEPENSVLEIVKGWSRSPRGATLAVLGRYQDDNAYHRAVRAAAGAEVRFLGAIYDKALVGALRLHGAGYLHGHQVGGTNPSLVEALGAGNAVLAHDNRFNRWVAQDGARYFSGENGFDAALHSLLAEPQAVAKMRAAAVRRFDSAFQWDVVLGAYEKLLTRFLVTTT